MHLLYENIPGHMFKHWYGCFYSNNNPGLNMNEYTIQKNIWTTIGQAIERNKKTIPTSFGHPPRNIVTHRNGFKAEEWANWVVLYSMPLLKDYLPKIIMQDPNYEEKFYFPTAIHYLNKSMVNKLKKQYLTCYGNKIILLQKEFSEYGKKYARMQTQNGGSMWQRKNKDFRINYGIAAQMKVDKWAAFKNRAPQFEIQEFYGRVEYYFVHQFNGKTHLMAFVQWTQNVNEDEYDLKFFREFGIKQFIDVQVIDQCIGFLKYKNIFFIIDKEVDDPDDSYLDSNSESD
ncbi:hypothetical protein GLOIN_2v1477115 [Rhizophagus clarus]|uniref:Uncharacterized protein n=1 Tax=Rhizophagus clarus TaxID=94130 RepID=A0A8H3M476_9GLOM|nr:hypothetical protein GLOIN_2v1477115 [Rhizophagus clarus]